MTVMAKAAAYFRRPEVRGAPLRFVGRRLRYEWELRFRPSALQRERVVRFDGDLRIALAPHDVVDRSIYLHGRYEPVTSEAFCDLVRPGGVVIDVGAHIGQFSLLAAKRVGPSGRVLAFEANPATRARLERNIALNHIDTVDVFGEALADADGERLLYLSDDPANVGMTSLRPGSGSVAVSVHCRRLDDVLQQAGITRVDAIKIDVEGAEPAVLAGSERTLREYKPAVVFEVNVGDHGAADALAMLRAQGYVLHGIEAGRDGVRLVPLGVHDDPWEHREAWMALNLVALHADRPPPGAAGPS